jgi:membrane protein DedA with SNARE-associated domain
MTGIAQFLANVEPLVRDYGALAVLVILTFESIGAPLPGESILIFASVLAERGELSLPSVLLAAWVGGVMGDNIGYLIGRKVGRAVLLRYGQKIGLNDERLTKVEAVFARYGPLTVGAARFFAVLRQLNGVVAGTLKMNWWQFLFFNALGCAVWVLFWGLSGYFLGEHVSNIKALAHQLGLVGATLAALALIIVGIFIVRHRRHAT